jgi:heavy metal sensor kinase
LKLTLGFSSILFWGLLLFGVAMCFNLENTLTRGRSRTLDRRADRMGELLRSTQTDSPEERARKFQAFATATGGGLTEVLRPDGSRALPSPSPDAQIFPWPTTAALGAERFTEVDFSDQPYRVLERPMSLGGPLVLCLAAPLENKRAVLRTFSYGLLWTVPALLALSALGGYLLSRRALKPVDHITATARSITLSNLSERLPVPRTGDELERLSETCNAMLGRLESAVDEIRRFTADASHELRSPLSYMRTVAELALRSRQTDAASRRAFEEIIEEGGKASRLLEDMLILARADSGTAHLMFEPVDLAAVAKVVCDRARLVAERKGHKLRVSLDTVNSAPIWGDYDSLQRLLWILLDNAIKYTVNPGDIHVSLSSGHNVVLSVRDSGIGIAATDLPHVFERFYRADPSRSQVEGSGLGLAIARWIADAHQAQISVESQEGAGSSFQVVFPVVAMGASHAVARLGESVLLS